VSPFDSFSSVCPANAGDTKPHSFKVNTEQWTCRNTRSAVSPTLLFAPGDRAVIAGVGDSKAYHCREKRTRLLRLLPAATSAQAS
jgi:serine/threonine protein phosphatase PrpC